MVQNVIPKRTKTASPNTTAANSSPPSSSEEIIADKDDLLNLIFLHLPTRSLIKFNSVSKHWLSLISNPNLSRCRHSNFPTSASGFFFMKHSRSRRARPEFDFIDLSHNSNPLAHLLDLSPLLTTGPIS